jgi:hypothetical protein
MYEDTPAWWLLKKKKTMYWDGGGNARSVRSLMQFMMSPLNLVSSIKREEATFRDIQAYLLSLERRSIRCRSTAIWPRRASSCSAPTRMRCHGTYGEKGTYPNKIVP